MRGYFDVDCRELSEDGESWVFRPRARPLEEGMLRLLAKAEADGAPVVATTCGSGRAPRDRFCPGGMVVPLDPGAAGWRDLLPGHRFFHLEKRCGSWDTFGDSPNPEAFFRLLDVDEWVVFGNALETCVDHAVTHLLRIGCTVHLVTDLLVDGAAVTATSRSEALARWRGSGVRETTLERLLEVA